MTKQEVWWRKVGRLLNHNVLSATEDVREVGIINDEEEACWRKVGRLLNRSVCQLQRLYEKWELLMVK